MDRTTAIALTIAFFFLFFLISYYGIRINIWSSIAIAVFLSFILLNLFYPISQLANDGTDPSLIIYAMLEIISIVVLAIYVMIKAVTDVRLD